MTTLQDNGCPKRSLILLLNLAFSILLGKGSFFNFIVISELSKVAIIDAQASIFCRLEMAIGKGEVCVRAKWSIRLELILVSVA